MASPTATQQGGVPTAGPGGRGGHQGAGGDEGGEDKDPPPHHYLSPSLFLYCFLPFVKCGEINLLENLT